MLSAALEADWSRTAAVISGFQMETTGGFGVSVARTRIACGIICSRTDN